MADKGHSHEKFEKLHIEGGSNRSFGFVFTGIFVIVTLFPLIHGNPARIWALAPAAAFLAAALLKPSILSPLNALWTKLSIFLGHVVTPIVMGLIFFLIFTPMGVVMRLAGRDALNRKLDPAAGSYWIKRDPPGPDPQTLKDQF